METLIFDIGKTNKKVFVFDEKMEVVYSEQRNFEEIQDEEGFPCDDLFAIEQWIKSVAKTLILDGKRNIQKVNFSTYGASLVHLDEAGKAILPFYNYLKPISKNCLYDFYKTNGDALKIALETASPPLDLLNSGLQLVWLKKEKEKQFFKIKSSLHFPQYLSYCFSGKPVSEYTSIGCHTALWDFSKEKYHKWISQENMKVLFPPIVSSDQTFLIDFFGKKIEVGPGIHDSSAALIPYLAKNKNPFLLISTGTWSISLNPFNDEPLSASELENDCLNYLQIDGKLVKAARLFLGQEYQYQVEELMKYFSFSEREINEIKFDEEFFKNTDSKPFYFNFKNLNPNWQMPEKTNYDFFKNTKEAYHQLMFELVEMQFASTQLAIGKKPIQQIFIDGGFTKNELYFEFLKRKFPNYLIRRMENENGSALGAAMVINQNKV